MLKLALVAVISAALVTPANADAAVTQLRTMSLEDKVGQLFVTWVHGQRADEPHPGNRKDFGVDTAAQVVEKYKVGGVIYFNNATRDNIDSPGQIATLSNGLQQASEVPLTIATDQEMGIVTRIGPPATQFPGNMALGAGRSTYDAEQAAKITATELRAMGINQDFAPDADVNSNPANPIIGVRSYSSDPKLASDLVKAQVKGYEQRMFAPSSVSATAKHFPGHGDTKDDSHTELPVANRTLEQWREIDAPPFRAAVAAKVDSIMTAHIQMPNIDPSGEPATLSHRIVTGLLRDELRYDGVIITDALEMAGVRKRHPDAEIPVLALKAGVDQLLMPVNLAQAIDSVVQAVRRNELTEHRINQSVLRVLKMKFLRGILTAKPVDENVQVGTPPRLAAAQRIADRTITAVRNDGNVLPFQPKQPLVVGTSETATKTLATKLNATAHVTALNPTPAQQDAAVKATEQADAVILLTNGLYLRTGQRDLLNRLLATGKPVVAVATGVPYDVGHTDAPVWLATYSTTAPSLEALAKILTGQAKPQGKLPVDVPGKYPFGHGLSW